MAVPLGNNSQACGGTGWQTETAEEQIGAAQSQGEGNVVGSLETALLGEMYRQCVCAKVIQSSQVGRLKRGVR